MTSVSSVWVIRNPGRPTNTYRPRLLASHQVSAHPRPKRAGEKRPLGPISIAQVRTEEVTSQVSLVAATFHRDHSNLASRMPSEPIFRIRTLRIQKALRDARKPQNPSSEVIMCVRPHPGRYVTLICDIMQIVHTNRLGRAEQKDPCLFYFLASAMSSQENRCIPCGGGTG